MGKKYKKREGYETSNQKNQQNMSTQTFDNRNAVSCIEYQSLVLKSKFRDERI